MAEENINTLIGSADEMIAFLNGYPGANLGMEQKDQFIHLLNRFPYHRVRMNATSAFNLEDDDNGEAIEYTANRLRAEVNDLANEDGLVITLIDQLKSQINNYKTMLTDDIEHPSVAHTQELNQGLQNIVALFNIANAAAGGRKKSRKSAKKSRKSAKKSRKSAKKSRKH